MPKRGADCEKLMWTYHGGDCLYCQSTKKKPGEGWQVRWWWYSPIFRLADSVSVSLTAPDYCSWCGYVAHVIHWMWMLRLNDVSNGLEPKSRLTVELWPMLNSSPKHSNTFFRSPEGGSGKSVALNLFVSLMKGHLDSTSSDRRTYVHISKCLSVAGFSAVHPPAAGRFIMSICHSPGLTARVLDDIYVYMCKAGPYSHRGYICFLISRISGAINQSSSLRFLARQLDWDGLW